jgi:hypothetical protein
MSDAQREEPDDLEAEEEELQHCQWGVGSNCPKGYEECGEPATHRVRFPGEDRGWLYLCPKHTRERRRTEER